ncbi:MAG: hypothetical protein ACJ75H_01145 [Thermoanaerobaculia bacterium]
MNREIGDSVERALGELRQEISQRLRASNEEIHRRLEEFTPSLPSTYVSHEDLAPVAERELGPRARQGVLRDLRDAVAALDRARSQSEILTALLRESGRFASRAAVLLVRGGDLRGWGSEGFGEAAEALRGLAFAAEDGAWGRAAQGGGAARLSAAEAGGLLGRAGAPASGEAVLIPIILRDRVAALLYADQREDGGLAVEALQVLAHSAAQAIETLPFRERAATSTLSLEESGEARPEPPAAAPKPAPAPEPEPEPEIEVEAEPEPAAYAEPEPAAAPWTAAEESSAVTAEPAGEVPEPAAPAGAWGSSAPSYTAEMPNLSAGPGPTDAMEAMEEEVPRYPRSVEPEQEQEAPSRFPQPVQTPAAADSPDATVLLQRPGIQQAAEQPVAAPPPLRPVPAPEEPAAFPPGTPEVRPPTGVDGPGWAFATTRVPISPNNEALHEEARRLARLLVSEIKLYNEEQVEEGRRNRDIYERLKEDIDRSRQMYDERVDPQILRSTDYFYQELVRILAAGDSRALGI